MMHYQRRKGLNQVNPCLKVCWSCLLFIRRRNWEATDFESSGMRAKASTSDIVSTVLVETSRFE